MFSVQVIIIALDDDISRCFKPVDNKKTKKKQKLDSNIVVNLRIYVYFARLIGEIDVNGVFLLIIETYIIYFSIINLLDSRNSRRFK